MLHKVSVLIPVFRVEKYIEKCARHLFEQTYQNIEIIFVDDCTPDNSINILNKVIECYPEVIKKVKILSHDKNRGLAATRNTALEAANGEYIIFVDSDDYLEYDFIAKMLNAIYREDADMAVCSVRHIWKNRSTIERPHIFSNTMDYTKSVIERNNILNIWGKLYKRNLFEQSKIRFIEGLNFGEDYVVLARLVYSIKKIAYIDKPLYNYIHFNTESYTYQLKHISVENLIMAESIISDYYKDKETDFVKSLVLGRLKIKAELLVSYFRNAQTDNLLYKKISSIYINDATAENMHGLSMQNKIILFLQMRNMTSILSCFIKYGSVIKQWIK